MKKPSLYMFEITEKHNDLGNQALRLILQRLDLQRLAEKDGGPDDAAATIACMVMLLCDFISDCLQPPSSRKTAVHGVLNIILATIAKSDFADDNEMALAVRKFVGEKLQENALQ